MGAKTKWRLLELDQLQVKEFRSHALNFLISATPYLQEKLPLNNQVIKDAHFLNPVNRNSKNTLNGISLLALTCGKLFKTFIPIVFNFKSDSVDEYKLYDIIKNEFTQYQTKIISEEFYIPDTPKDTSKFLDQNSYWQEANELVIDKKRTWWWRIRRD